MRIHIHRVQRDYSPAPLSPLCSTGRWRSRLDTSHHPHLVPSSPQLAWYRHHVLELSKLCTKHTFTSHNLIACLSAEVHSCSTSIWEATGVLNVCGLTGQKCGTVSEWKQKGQGCGPSAWCLPTMHEALGSILRITKIICYYFQVFHCSTMGLIDSMAEGEADQWILSGTQILRPSLQCKKWKLLFVKACTHQGLHCHIQRHPRFKSSVGQHTRIHRLFNSACIQDILLLDLDSNSS